MIVPGSVNPLLLAQAGDPLDELGAIARSLRFRASASAFLSRTNGATDSSKTLTHRVCLKLGILDANNRMLLFGFVNINNYAYFSVSNGQLFLTFVIGGTSYNLTELPIRRDPIAFYDVVLGIDTTQAVATERVTIEVNGAAVSLTGSYPPQNAATGFDYPASAQYIGVNDPTFRSATNFFDGEMAAIAHVGGSKIPSSSFGQFHPKTSQWRTKTKAATKAVVDAGGVNGYFLPFDDPTSLVTLCADASSKGNNWTGTNISLTAGATDDSMLDTPTNNFCTLNPLSNTLTLANGALDAAGGVVTTAAHGTIQAPSNVPVYWEIENATNNSASVAIGAGVARSYVPPSANYQGSGGAGIAGFYSSTTPYVLHDDGTTTAISAATTDAGDVLQVAINGLNGWVGRNDVWFDSAGGTTGNPATGVNPTFTLNSAYSYVPYVQAASNTGRVNFGQRAWSKACPAGFNALCANNLPYPTIPKSESAFVARTDSGANIVATLSAAAPWTSWIRIYKRRDAAEGWRWQFSDDSANYLDSSSTAAKAAFPALGGAAYVGYALKVSAQNGIATGTVAHTNGQADTINHNFNRPRSMILMKPENLVGDWLIYHPDLTAGNLLSFTSAGQTANGSIAAAGANSFQLAAALPSGTYRYIVIGETDGFAKLGKYTGNGSTDGPFLAAGFLPGLVLWKRLDGTYFWISESAVSNPNNQATLALYPNANNGESNDAPIDIVSNGHKVRANGATYGATNSNGANYVYLSIAAFPFRYANSR